MSLKGYEWLRDGEVIMNFTFKRLELFLFDDVTEEEYNEFCKFLDEHSFNTRYLKENNHKIIRA